MLRKRETKPASLYLSPFCTLYVILRISRLIYITETQPQPFQYREYQNKLHISEPWIENFVGSVGGGGGGGRFGTSLPRLLTAFLLLLLSPAWNKWHFSNVSRDPLQAVLLTAEGGKASGTMHGCFNQLLRVKHLLQASPLDLPLPKQWELKRPSLTPPHPTHTILLPYTIYSRADCHLRHLYTSLQK